MQEEPTISVIDDEPPPWMSTYALITAERILEYYHVRYLNLSHGDLIRSLCNQDSLLCRLLQVSFKEVLNGIILQQAKDYQNYINKSLIDYLLSGEQSKAATEPGAVTRESVERERELMVAVSEEFRSHEFAHEQLIANSQKEIIQFMIDWVKKNRQIAAKLSKQLNIDNKFQMTQCLNSLLVDYHSSADWFEKEEIWVQPEILLGGKLTANVKLKLVDAVNDLSLLPYEIESKLDNFNQQANIIKGTMVKFRNKFMEQLISVRELLSLIVEYQAPAESMRLNKEDIAGVDTAIGS